MNTRKWNSDPVQLHNVAEAGNVTVESKEKKTESKMEWIAGVVGREEAKCLIKTRWTHPDKVDTKAEWSSKLERQNKVDKKTKTQI